MKFPFIDLVAQHRELEDKLLPKVREVFAGARFIMGEEPLALENELAKWCGTSHAVGCDSGTRALELILRALEIGPGDEVITTPFTFFATASSIIQVGAKPVFVDIEPTSLNLDPELLAAKITPRTKAIMVVHLFGLMADMPRILELAGEIPVIEDACQAIGAEIKGRRAGSWGRAAALSFFPTKNLGGAGDGGMVLTSDPVLAERVSVLRNHGSRLTYHHEEIGCTGRLDALQAAVLRVKLPSLEAWNRARSENGKVYDEAFSKLDYRLQIAPQGFLNVRHQYALLTKNRDELVAYLNEKELPHAIYYPIPVHLQKPFLELGYSVGDFICAEAAAESILSLPVCPYLRQENRQLMIEALTEWGRV